MPAYLALTPYDRRPEPGMGETRLRVLEGPGSWLVGTERGAVPTDRPAGTAAYEQIFASADAGPLGTYGPHLYAIEIDVSPGVDLADFHRWYDRTHVPAVAPAGLLRGRRFAALDAARTFLAVYEMADRDVLSSRALAEVRGFDEFTPSVTVRCRRVLERAA